MKPVTPQLQLEMQGNITSCTFSLLELQSLPFPAIAGLVESVIQSLNFPPELEPLQLEGNDENTLVYLLATAISPEHRCQEAYHHI